MGGDDKNATTIDVAYRQGNRIAEQGQRACRKKSDAFMTAKDG